MKLLSVHYMKEYKVSRGLAPLILNLVARCRWVVLRWLFRENKKTPVPIKQDVLWAPQPGWRGTLSTIAGVNFVSCMDKVSVGVAQSVKGLSYGLDSSRIVCEILSTRPYRSFGPPRLLQIGYRFSFQGVKRPERGVDHPPPSSA